jgi:hypothetical protein
LAEIEHAVIEHCVAHAPSPPYKPQEIKKRLRSCGWIPEVRLKPFRARHDELPINERYDLWKPFALSDKRIGVAVEMEPWNVWTDLLKFRRGLQRGQIHVGVVLHDNPEHMTYVYEHLRLVSEPLFGKLPVLFAAPAGPGLKGRPRSERRFKPYRRPNDPTMWEGAQRHPRVSSAVTAAVWVARNLRRARGAGRHELQHVPR